MKKVVHKKLVRDKIPEIIVANGATLKMRVLNDQEFASAVDDKILEEARELVDAEIREDVLKELADLKEIALAKANLFQITDQEIETERVKRGGARGTFMQKIFLEEVEEK